MNPTSHNPTPEMLRKLCKIFEDVALSDYVWELQNKKTGEAFEIGYKLDAKPTPWTYGDSGQVTRDQLVTLLAALGDAWVWRMANALMEQVSKYLHYAKAVMDLFRVGEGKDVLQEILILSGKGEAAGGSTLGSNAGNAGAPNTAPDETPTPITNWKPVTGKLN